MNLDAIAIGQDPPHDVNAVIEVSNGGEPIKYGLDKRAGTLVVDRFLYTPMRYPGNYGFVPHTLSEDGDPIDVLVANTRPIVPGAVINVRPIGVFKRIHLLPRRACNDNSVYFTRPDRLQSLLSLPKPGDQFVSGQQIVIRRVFVSGKVRHQIFSCLA